MFSQDDIVIVAKEKMLSATILSIWLGWHHALTKKVTHGSLYMLDMQQKQAAKSSWPKPSTQMYSYLSS